MIMIDEMIEKITNLLKNCKDAELLDLILKLLQKTAQ